MQEGFAGWALHQMVQAAVREDQPGGLRSDAAAGTAGSVTVLVAAALAGDQLDEIQVVEAAELAAEATVLDVAELEGGSIGLAGNAVESGWDGTSASWAHAMHLGSEGQGALVAAA